jgi:hypothetical protein
MLFPYNEGKLLTRNKYLKNLRPEMCRYDGQIQENSRSDFSEWNQTQSETIRHFAITLPSAISEDQRNVVFLRRNTIQNYKQSIKCKTKSSSCHPVFILMNPQFSFPSF